MGKAHIAGHWYAVAAAGCLVACYLPFVLVPFLQDDFVFLYHAQQQAAGGDWLAWARSASGEATFWRPISVGLYWKLVHGLLRGNPAAAHLVNMFALAATAVSGGLLARLLARRDSDVESSPMRTAFWPVLLFGLSGCWLLPVAWTCAVQETFACLFSSLSLLAFAGFLRSRRGRAVAMGFLALALFALALLSKEGTIVVPALAGLIAWHLKTRFDRRLGAMALASAVMLAAWFYGRSIMTHVPENSPYTPTAGLNVLRNGIALPLFMLNFPREAMVGWLTSRSIPMLLWGLACFALQAAAMAGFVRLALPRLPWKPMAAWIAIALLPYMVLRSQSYPYYAGLALLAYPWLIARAGASSRRGFGVCAGLALASSLCVYCVQPFLPRPAPVARAVWAERALAQLVYQNSLSRPPDGPIALVVKDEASYAAGGYSAGPAMALGITQEQLVDVRERPLPPGGPSGQRQTWSLTVDSRGYLWAPY